MTVLRAPFSKLLPSSKLPEKIISKLEDWRIKSGISHAPVTPLEYKPMIKPVMEVYKSKQDVILRKYEPYLADPVRPERTDLHHSMYFRNSSIWQPIHFDFNTKSKVGHIMLNDDDRVLVYRVWAKYNFPGNLLYLVSIVEYCDNLTVSKPYIDAMANTDVEPEFDGNNTMFLEKMRTIG